MRQSPSLDVHITGWAHSRFGKLPATLEELVVEVTREALTSAEIEPSDIDAIYYSHYNGGMHPLTFGAALVLSAGPTPPATRHGAVRFLGVGHATDHFPAAKRDPLAFAAGALAWRRALDMAGVELADLSFLEVHDCFTLAELVLYETLGLAPAGKGRTLLDDGTVYRDGGLPVNPSGGLKSKGHPVGATGVSQHVLAAMQLTGTAGDMQVPDASVAAVHNMGGLAVANHVSVLSAG